MRQIQTMHSDDISGENPLGLEVFSSDGQPIGRINGYVEAIAETEEDTAEGQVDVIDREGHLLGPRRVTIDGRGYVTQAEIAVPLSTLVLDFKGRRATLPMTLTQIEQIPHRDPKNADAPPLNR